MRDAILFGVAATLAGAAFGGTVGESEGPSATPCPPAAAACAKDDNCAAFGVFRGAYQLHGCADPDALVPNNDWAIWVPATANKSSWKALGKPVNVDESKCAVHPHGIDGSCGPPPPPSPPAPPRKLPYEALGSLDVGTGESSIFLVNGTRFLLDNIFCGYIDHAGNWDPAFAGHSYVRIRELETGRLIANVSETIATDFVSAFVDHRPTGDVLWLSALDADRCKHAGAAAQRRQRRGPHYACGKGVLALRSTDLVHFSRSVALPSTSTCNTEVAGVAASPPSLPPHRYVMILEPFTFMVNNNADGDLTHGWVPAAGSRPPKAPAGGPSIRYEGGHYYVITGGTTVFLCRSTDLGATDPWACVVMVRPTGRGGAPGPGDGAVAPFAGFAQDAERKKFPVMEHDLGGWDWNSNDADVCCTGGSTPSYIIWGASTQGARPHLPPGSPSCTNAIGRANVTLEVLLQSFFDNATTAALAGQAPADGGGKEDETPDGHAAEHGGDQKAGAMQEAAGLPTPVINLRVTRDPHLNGDCPLKPAHMDIAGFDKAGKAIMSILEEGGHSARVKVDKGTVFTAWVNHSCTYNRTTLGHPVTVSTESDGSGVVRTDGGPLYYWLYNATLDPWAREVPCGIFVRRADVEVVNASVVDAPLPA